MCGEDEGKNQGERGRQRKGRDTQRGLVTLQETEGRWKPRSFTVKWQQNKQMIPSPGTEDREVKVL